MGRARGLSNTEKATIVKETEKSSSPWPYSYKIGLPYWNYEEKNSPHKQRSDSGVLKSGIVRDFRNIEKIVFVNPL